MDSLPYYIDTLLIYPFRLPQNALAGVLLGTLVLCVLCIIIGELTAAGLFFAHKHYHTTLRKEMVDAHNSSVNALHAGSKEGYKAINRLANEKFGKYFFAQAAMGTASLWPLPFALWWMSLRFEGVGFFTLPLTNWQVGYVPLCLLLYIAMRIGFARFKKHLPLFRTIHAVQEEAKRSAGSMRSFRNDEQF